jgi:hypothetical protein
LVRNILQDTQARLVFRAESYIHGDIQRYIPNTSDLDYPNILQSKIYGCCEKTSSPEIHGLHSFYIGSRKSSIPLSPPVTNAVQSYSQLNDTATLDVSEDGDPEPTDSAKPDLVSSPATTSISSPPHAFTNTNATWFPT